MSESGSTQDAKSVLRTLAEIYPQLYLTPGDEGARLWQDIVRRGDDAPTHSLDHFHGSDQDSLEEEQTPAGPVRVVTLGNREDFETFLQIMACKCVPTEIPATQGASMLDGVVNWTKIRAHKAEWLAEGGQEENWPEDFKSFTSDRSNYTDALVVLSTGPYSAVPAADAGMGEEEWLAASLQIRRAHECTHFICRRLYPDKKDAIWDELAADAVGLYAAFARYDLRLACLFLGIDKSGYTGGRLENYATEEDDLNALAQKVCRMLLRLEDYINSRSQTAPYDLAISLEEDVYEIWKSGNL